MKRGRKINSTSGYVMNKHKNGSYFYAYTLRPFTVEDKVVYRRCQWGRLDDKLKFTPGLSFLRLSDEEKAKFVFPKDWDLSEIAEIVNNKANNTSSTGSNSDQRENFPSNLFQDDDLGDIDFSEIEDSEAGETPTDESLNFDASAATPMLCGISWLVEIWAKKIGLTDDLYGALNEDQEFVNVILSMMSYAMIFNFSLDSVAPTQSFARYSTTTLLTEKVLEEVISKFGDREFEKFFKLWVKRCNDDKIWAFDSTLTGDMHEESDPLGIQSYVFRYGYDVQNALKSEFLILFSMSTGYPLCFLNYGEDNEEFPNFSDTLKRFKNFGVKDFVLFTNRRYDGVHIQVDLLALGGQKLIMPMENTSADMDLLVSKIDLKDHLPTNMQWDERSNVYYSQFRCDIVSGKKVGPASRISLYYSPEKDMRDRMKIQRRLDMMNENVESLVGQDSIVYKEDFSSANNLMEIEYIPVNADPHFSVVKSDSINKSRVKELTKMCGFYALRSFNLDLNPKEITDILRFASERKKDLGIMKDLLNLQRRYDRDVAPSLKTIIKGKRFVLFLTRIISASLYRAFISSKRLSDNFRDVVEMIMEMSSIRGYYQGDKLVGCTPLTPKQRIVVEELHLYRYSGKEKSEISQMLLRMLHQNKEK